MGVRKYFIDKMLAAWEKSDNAKLAGKSFPAGVLAEKNLCYAQDGVRGHLLDVYYPSQIKEKLPVLIDIHGGGFMSGYKELDCLFGYYMAKRGFLVFNLNYRLALSGVKVTTQIQDIALATKWVSNHLDKYNGDRSTILLCGHSAGAVLAAIEALRVQSARLQKIFDTEEGGFISYQGLILDCGMMTFYENTIGYWGMRNMVFDKGYRHDIKYGNMIWRKIPELATLPKTYLISNEKDELRHMTLEFKKILDERKIENLMNFQANEALGHMAVIYAPDSVGCSLIIDEMTHYLLR